MTTEELIKRLREGCKRLSPCGPYVDEQAANALMCEAADELEAFAYTAASKKEFGAAVARDKKRAECRVQEANRLNAEEVRRHQRDLDRASMDISEHARYGDE